MNEEEIEKQLKKSRRQNKDERYEYINSHFNQTNYAMALEKYILKNLRKNKRLQNNWNELKNIIEKGIIDSKAGSSQQYYFNTIYKYMQELEQVKD